MRTPTRRLKIPSSGKCVEQQDLSVSFQGLGGKFKNRYIAPILHGRTCFCGAATTFLSAKGPANAGYAISQDPR